MIARPTRDATGLALAQIWALRGTCARRQVGCVLVDAYGWPVSSGYNGPASGLPHCRNFGDGENYRRCAGAEQPSGAGLDLCEAVHAEANALMRCADVRQISTCYVTHSPCVSCTKLLLNTSCQFVVFGERYAHDAAAKELWTRAGRVWTHHVELSDAPDSWQSIDTAPKRLVLVRGPSGYRGHRYFYVSAYHDQEHDRWLDTANTALQDRGWEPTEWRELP